VPVDYRNLFNLWRKCVGLSIYQKKKRNNDTLCTTARDSHTNTFQNKLQQFRTSQLDAKFHRHPWAIISISDFSKRLTNPGRICSEDVTTVLDIILRYACENHPVKVAPFRPVDEHLKMASLVKNRVSPLDLCVQKVSICAGAS
jgi:hypothetical protein